MRREEEVPFLYQEPSAPPLPFTSARNNRIVQPFEIATEIYSVAETVPTIRSHQQPSRPSVILSAGKTESRQLDAKIAAGNSDGNRIVYNDSDVTNRSNYKGFSEHQQLDRMINMSESDYVHELGASLPLPTVTYATVCESNSAAEEKIRAAEEAAKPSGYQFSDYTSTYEVSGGYKYEDYKSIYDK